MGIRINFFSDIYVNTKKLKNHNISEFRYSWGCQKIVRKKGEKKMKSGNADPGEVDRIRPLRKNRIHIQPKEKHDLDPI